MWRSSFRTELRDDLVPKASLVESGVVALYARYSRNERDAAGRSQGAEGV